MLHGNFYDDSWLHEILIGALGGAIVIIFAIGFFILLDKSRK